MQKKRHAPDEIAAKLIQADEMIAAGQRQGEIARALGVSVMTYHRWRKARGADTGRNHPAPAAAAGPEAERIRELMLENSRLRRLVTDLLLEKMKLEEALSSRSR